MLEYDRIDISEGIDIIKTNASKICDICHYWYLKDIGFKFEPYLCNGCHGLIQKAISFNDVAIVSIYGSDYRINFWYMSKNNTITTMKNSNLNEKKRIITICLLCLKMREATYYKRAKRLL